METDKVQLNSAPPIDPEQEQLLKMDYLRRLVQLLLQKYIFPLALVFVGLILIQSVYVVIKAKKSPTRFTAELGLLFQPKDSDYIKSMDDNAMLQLFSRTVIAARTTEELHKIGFDKSVNASNIAIVQKQNHWHIFTITASGNTADEALAKANVFARICKEEYQNFRMADLANWTGIANQQHREYEEKIHDTSEQMVALARELGLPNLDGEQTRLTKLLGDQEHSLSALNVRYADTQNRKKKLELAIKEINPQAVRYTAKIRDMLDKIADISNELAFQTPLYTENNPKLQALHERLAAAEDAYEAFLKVQGITDFDPNTLDVAEKLQKEYEQLLTDETTISTNITVLKAEISNNHELLNKIVEYLPRLNQLKLLQDTNLRAMETAESRLTDLNYLKTSAENELQPIEQANLSDREYAFNKKSVVLILFVTIFLTSCCAFVLLILQLTLGRLRNYSELECYYGLTPIGAIPLYYQSYADGDSRGRFALSEIYYKFYQLCPHAKRLFIGTPETNANIPQTVGDALIRQFATNGKRLLLIRIVSAQDYEVPEELTPLNVIFYSGNRGVFPVENPRTLSGAELSMLSEDLRELEADYDAIAIIRYGNMATCGILFQQMFDICDTSMLLVVPKQTPRSTLRYLLNIHQKAEHTLYATMLDTQSYENSNRG